MDTTIPPKPAESNKTDMAVAPAPAINEPAPKPVTSDVAPASTPLAPRTHNTAIAAVVMAIVVALGLGAIGTMAYMNTKNSVQPAPQASAVLPTPKVTANDISKTTDDMNAGVKTIDDNQDFGPNDLSDTTLGIQ